MLAFSKRPQAVVALYMLCSYLCEWHQTRLQQHQDQTAEAQLDRPHKWQPLQQQYASIVTEPPKYVVDSTYSYEEFYDLM